MQRASGTLNYTVSVTRTSRAPLDLAPESNDIPGIAAGPGTITQVVSTKADGDDVYAVGLTAGQPVTVRLIPLTPFTNNSSLAYLSILDPSTSSIASYQGHRVTDRVLAKNAKRAADRQTAEIQYTPTQTGTYYVWVEAGGVITGYNFAYQLSISGGAEPPEGFLDVPPGSDYEEAIYALADAGIITGFPDQTFRPDAPVIRQQFAKMIVKTLNLPMTGNEVCPFTDVDGQIGLDPWYPSKYVAVCADYGITQGITETLFDPWGFITHQQLITMVARGADVPEAPQTTPPFLPSQFDPREHYVNARDAAYAGLLDGLLGVGPVLRLLRTLHPGRVRPGALQPAAEPVGCRRSPGFLLLRLESRRPLKYPGDVLSQGAHGVLGVRWRSRSVPQ